MPQERLNLFILVACPIQVTIMDAMLRRIVSRTWYIMVRSHSKIHSKYSILENRTLPIILRSNLDSASRSWTLIYWHGLQSSLLRTLFSPMSLCSSWQDLLPEVGMPRRNPKISLFMVMVVPLTVPTTPFGVLAVVPKNSLTRLEQVGRFKEQSFSKPIVARFYPIENLPS